MKTEVVKIENIGDAKDAFLRAGKIIKNGGLVVFPTETVYGLGASALDGDAAAKIYEAKGRPSDNPLIVHVCAPGQADEFAYTDERYKALAKAFMPGPLTVIMPKRDCIPDRVSGGLDSVGIRCPQNEIAREFIRACGVPIAAPSANISGKPSPTRAEHVLRDMDGKVDMIIDGGACEIGLESTIVKLESGKAVLLRPGAITYDALCIVLGDVEISRACLEKLGENERPLSPGMKYRHYAPAAPLTLLRGEDKARVDFMKAQSVNAVLLVYDEEKNIFENRKVITIGKKNDMLSQAARLFAALREADLAGGSEIFAPCPCANGVGLALYNRLIRAAAHNIKDI